MMVRYRFALLWALGSLGVPSIALAETAEPEPSVSPEAAKLFDEGRRLRAEGKLSDACERFEQSLALSGGIGIKFNLADCFEQVGKTHSAHALFVEVAETTRALGQVKRQRAATERVTALEAKLSRITLQTPQRAELRLTLDGRELEPAQLEAAFTVDPGKHALVAREPGKKDWTLELDVPAGPTHVVVVVPELDPEPKKLAPATKASAKPAPPVRTKPEGPNATGSSSTTLALILGGVGVAGLAGGGYMGLRYLESQDEAKATCPSSRNCTTAEIDKHRAAVDDAQTARLWSFVGAGAGAAALGVAAYLYFTDEGTGTQVAASPIAGDGTFGAVVSGRF